MIKVNLLSLLSSHFRQLPKKALQAPMLGNINTDYM